MLNYIVSHHTAAVAWAGERMTMKELFIYNSTLSDSLSVTPPSSFFPLYDPRLVGLLANVIRLLLVVPLSD